MTKYRSYMQETCRTYDNPVEEEISKTIMSYLRFYGYYPVTKSQRFVDCSYKSIFTNGHNIVTLEFGKKNEILNAVLIEYEGMEEISPVRRIDFVKKEILEYIGSLRDRCIIYTTDDYKTCYYYSSLAYQGLKDKEYYKNEISSGTMPDGVRDNSEFSATMMRIVAAADYANEIRCLREGEPVYQGRQVNDNVQKRIN